MKRAFTIIVATMLLTLTTWAQDNKRPRFNPEEFKAKMEAFITQKAELTPAEAEKVFPIFEEMKNKQYEIMKKAQKLKHKSDDQFKDDEEYRDALAKMGELNIEMAKIETAYYKKMCKAVSAKKAYRIKMADDAFHREVLQRFNHKQKDKNPPKRKP